MPAQATLSPQSHILFVSTFHTPFIDDDLNVLSKDHRVNVRIGSGPLHVFKVLLGVISSQSVFCWFASVYASLAVLAATLLGKKSVIVVGGVDMAKEKEFGYGLWLSFWKSMLVRAAIKRATRVLAVDESLRIDVLSRVGYDGRNLEVLPTGYDSAYWYPAGDKEPLVLTVAVIQTEGRLKIKGIDILFDVARRLPDVKFVLIGLDPATVRFPVPPSNLKILPPVEQAELLLHYQQARIYCQPSRREGLSNTLCEAMLCGCIPVVSDVGGSAHAIGGNGIVVAPGDPAALAAGIQRALQLPATVGTNARERVGTLFPKQRREERLRALTEELNR